MHSLKAQQWISLILYGGSLLLLLEWIFPLEEVTDTSFTSTFVMYIVLCFILSATQLPYWIVSPVKLLGLLFVMHQLYFEPTFFTKAWFELFWLDLNTNLSFLWARDWVSLTSSFRTLLFLILLWMLSYLLYYWFAVRKKPFSFILFTFIYLTVLDTFTAFDASTPIIRAFIIGVAVMGVAYLQHLLENENMRMPAMKTMVKWIGPLLIVIGFSTIIGYAAPKYDPIWPDPVPFIQSTAEGSGYGDGPGGGVQRIGYGENDERLGGGFVQDDTTVFYAQAPKSQYWKVETKDTYTGHGWTRSQDGQFEHSEGSLEGLQEYSDLVDLNDDHAQIQFVEPGFLNKLVYTYGVEHVTPVHDGMSLEFNRITGEVLSKVDGQTRLPESYEIDMQRPFFPVEEMRTVTEKGELDQYLQLPDSLPDRVVSLAEEITAEHDNRYDKAKAVEEFFSSNGFIYETQDVAVPDGDEDYVDQFLFETQVGYCDNFSTSMVVLLRSVDIPARWVKGFTEGERLTGEDYFEGHQPEYEITNNNAHSWVEVYFPNVGWVPFEPTVGFNNQSSFSYGETLDDILEEEEQDYEQPESSETPELPEGEEEEEDESDDQAVASGSMSQPLKYSLIGAGVVLLTIIIWLLMKKRLVIVSKWKKRKMENYTDVETFTEAYQFLLRALAHKGLVFGEGQTLREFAVDVDRWFGENHMSQLTAYYERAIYRDESIDSHHAEVNQLWNKLVNDVLA
ncbi:DUF4129 domain-containing transglutaminase family protein [Piscibacillus halophilus]|uniref:Transglutaminase-like enzyme, putative cysteine protease n=1 Tax=Piscibacillus halophilus TaxID=571933 RepID=A0A1H9G555_9BACI|nr:DUF4129 domain-containing transglutaminase family protein [Piscibacillus halophilus]SEQ45202.1 Transglutaminase-like enzyme, putative cysteine protease [Piscibacillus halophilus]